MDNKYFLYIDILGFSDLVKDNPSEVDNIYKILDTLNVHRHHAFKTIVFSDTILVYNIGTPITKHDNEYVVMFACEFIQDLIYHLANRNIYFRAILTFDEFKHYNLNNIECYYGNALVNCYNKEKEINGIGLFIDKRIAKYNKIFPTVHFDRDLDYVCLLQCIERLYGNTQGILPSNDLVTINNTDEYWAIKFELNYLRNIYNNSLEHPNVKIRSKFLQTYQLYKNLYKPLLLVFESTDFDVMTINASADWSQKNDTYE